MSPLPHRRLLERLYRAALSGVDPEAAVIRAVGSRAVQGALAGRRRVGIFAAGKAAAAMARGALKTLPHGPALVVLSGQSPARGLAGALVLRASHPEPDAGSLAAARRALRFFESFGSDDAIVCLISGGTSSLLALPRPGVTLSQKRRAIRALDRSGASILALNRLRTSLSAVKGGRLGRATRARLVTLVLSDVPGDRASAVGSGPTVRGRSGDVVRVVGTNHSGIRAAAQEARRLGWRVVLAPGRLSGEARSAGRRLARQARNLSPRTVWLAGGETVVTLGSVRRLGGRAMELALAASIGLEGRPELVWLAAGSDGRDGSSPAAGAFGSGDTVARAHRRGLDPRRALRLHDTHDFFKRMGDLFVPGETGTNVSDWVFLLRIPLP